METVFVTGGAGFIGSALVRRLVRGGECNVVVLDSLTYAGSLQSLADVSESPRFQHARVDVGDSYKVRELLDTYQPTTVYHLAAETHVDRSIDSPAAFLHSNVNGTFGLLQACLRYWRSGTESARALRLLHVSTDEVFGSTEGEAFSEESPYRPRSPYAATKAAADHLVRAWHITYGLPVVLTNCCNNFGPYQFPEKLIPLTIQRALDGRSLPVYGDGLHERDWLFVEDHVDALIRVAKSGRIGETYAVSTNASQRNIDVVRSVCDVLDRVRPAAAPHTRLIEFVDDRPGHDRRYALDSAKIRAELGWAPQLAFGDALARTVEWYVAHQDWCANMLESTYDGGRLGLAPE